MQRLRGSFSATPIEHDHTLRPFLNPRLIRKQARNRMNMRKGFTGHETKDEMRQAGIDAAAKHPITRIPAGKRRG